MNIRRKEEQKIIPVQSYSTGVDMRILVMSDSHAYSMDWIDAELVSDIKNADVVLHAGDIGSDSFFAELRKISKQLFVVKGNNDFWPIPKNIVVDLNNVRFAVTHGDGFRLTDIYTYLDYKFDEYKPDIIVYGHTHVPYLSKEQPPVIMNPGSCTNNRGLKYNSYVIVGITSTGFDIIFKKI